ncbi:hypothetical protein [Sebaldella sp. S0638]|uniref:hypothetical protein n=1 Tax=Sebaldella sp. S0638 TaxID=2957809 RepID=UPI00209CF135|nr:hypothetical protein [Sebaldella sp. S0638]MCP1226227.1 hypothetical protein [Sebaldella sp. S0638]
MNGDKATIAITGTGYGLRVADASFNWYGHNDSSTNTGTVNIGAYSSNVGYFHAFLNALAGSYTLEGNWDFRNETTNAFVNNASNNTVRFVSVNHAYHALNQTTVFRIDPDSIINLYGRSDGHMTVGVEFQFYQALPAQAINEGTINLQSGTSLFGMTAMIERDGSSSGKRPLYESSLENRGKIVINSNESIGIDFAKYRFENQKELTIYVGLGNIEVNGEKNYGARVPQIWDEVANGKNYFKETVIDGAGGTIDVNGKENVGISLSKQITGSSTVASYNGLNVSDSTDIIGNIRNLNIKVNGEKTVGILRNSNFSNLSPETITFNNSNLSTLTFGNDAKDSILIRTDKYGVVLEKDLSVDNENAVNSSENNIILLANDVNGLGSKRTFIENKATLNVGENLKKTTGLMAVNGGYLVNSGDINIESDESNGLVILGNSSGYNEGNIKLTGDGSLGVYNLGDFVMDSGDITLTGKQSVGFYSSSAVGTASIKDSKIDLQGSGVNMFLTDGAAVNMENVELGVGSGGLLTYTYANKTTKVSSGHINITGSSEARIGSDGTAFYLRGNLEDITTFINNVFTGTGKLDLYMDSPDARLFILDSPDNPINLSSVTDTGVSSYVPGNKVNIIGTGYKPYSILKGKLTIDQNADLDDSSDPYTRLEFFSSKVTVNHGVGISGDNASQSGIAQKNYSGTTGRNEIELINNGDITLGGTKSIGIIADYGVIENNGNITMSGDEAVGLYGSNGTLIKNTGSIYTGSNGIGIYASNNLSASSALYGNKEIEIINDGTVKVGGTGNGVGIFANNAENKISTVTLGSNSKIDVSTGKSNIGVFAKNSSVTAEGEVSIGDKGIGIYLNESTAGINNLVTNITGNNAIGYHITPGSTVTGKDNVLFNYISSVPVGTYINYGNFSVNAAVDSTYIGANLENGAFYNNAAHVLTEGSRLVLGENSGVCKKVCKLNLI